ncbi:MAG: hypothetical protein JNL95_08990 [Chitinophagales bacterium]|nr:hypothetical protein [Chitinophagales bacterium]
MRKLIFATILGATITLSAQAATPRTENKTQYEQGRKNHDYKKNDWERHKSSRYDAKKSDFKHEQWKRNSKGKMRHNDSDRRRCRNEYRHNPTDHRKQYHYVHCTRK